jgi:imidazole glycerol phosphate synthase subunit HisF
MVWDVYRAVRIPIIGMGGIMNGEDAIEFMLAGASAIQVGTANLIRPTACHDVITEMESIALSEKMDSIEPIHRSAATLVMISCLHQDFLEELFRGTRSIDHQSIVRYHGRPGQSG